MAKITIDKDGNKLVPSTVTIPFIEGDGVGAEITPVMQQVVDAAVEKAYKGNRKIEWLRCWPAARLMTIQGNGFPVRPLMLSATISSVSKAH